MAHRISALVQSTMDLVAPLTDFLAPDPVDEAILGPGDVLTYEFTEVSDDIDTRVDWPDSPFMGSADQTAKTGPTLLPGPETLIGTSGDDVIRGGGGNDVILGRAGDDRLYGGTGRDRIDGQNGQDQVYGGRGNDLMLTGGRGNDSVFGNGGGDRIKDFKGKANELFGGTGRDDISGRGLLDGGVGADELAGNGTFVGGTGDDQITSRKAGLSDVFDFRLGGAAGFGSDEVSNYTYDRTGSTTAGRDMLLFDTGTQVAINYVQSLAGVELVATVSGDETGRVLMTGLPASSLTQTQLDHVVQGIFDDLVFV